MQEAATLRQVALRRSNVAVDAVLVVAGALLVAVAAQFRIQLPFTPVPITGQTFAVLLVGASLGSWRGGISMLLYVLMGAAGLPVYAHAAFGWKVIVGVSGGYLLSYPIAGAAIGYLSEQGWDRRFRTSIPAMLVGNIIIYLVGLPWLAWVLHTGLNKTLVLGFYPFIPGDTFKLLLAAGAFPSIWHLIRRFRREGSGKTS